VLYDALREAWAGVSYDEDLAEHFFESVGVEGRHLALAPDQYAVLETFGETNDHYVERGTEIGARAVESAIRDTGAELGELDALFFTTVTGVASPSLDAKIINELELGRRVDRVPMFGLGCVGGAAGLARLTDYLRGHPERTAALVSVELCSLTLERNDPGVADMIAAALFGDGAAAVVCDGAEVARETAGPAPRVPSTGGVLYRDTEWVMGWEVGGEGFELVLSGDLPRVIESELRSDVAAFLDGHGLALSDVGRWVCHPGGPKVLDAIEDALAFEDGELASARQSLRAIGNLSSASVLHVLDGRLDELDDWSEPGVLMAMGPGFSAEFVLLE
jgi:alkylresorcinol/alkylpyrone synthase